MNPPQPQAPGTPTGAAPDRPDPADPLPHLPHDEREAAALLDAAQRARDTISRGQYDGRLTCVFGVAKSASRRFSAMLATLNDERSQRRNLARLDYASRFRAFELRPDTAVEAPAGGVMHIQSHPTPPTLAALETLGARYVILLRHPADQVSAYTCYMRYLRYRRMCAEAGLEVERGVEPPGWRDAVAEMSVAHFVEHALHRSLSLMADWLDWHGRQTPDARTRGTVARFEDFVHDPRSCLSDTYHALHGRGPDPDLMAAALPRFPRSDAERARLNLPDVYPHGDTGHSGIWRHYFDDDTAARFQRVAHAFADLHPGAARLDEHYPGWRDLAGPEPLESAPATVPDAVTTPAPATHEKEAASLTRTPDLNDPTIEATEPAAHASDPSAESTDASPPVTESYAETPVVRVVSAAQTTRQRGLADYVEHLRWLAQHAGLVRSLTQTQLKLTVSRSRLYYLWWLLDPILDTACYAILFILIRASAGSGADSHIPMIAFLLSGMVPWRLTSACWMSAGNTWTSYRALIEQVRFPHLVLLISRFFSEFWLYTIALGVLALACVVFGVMPTWLWLLVPLWVVVHALTVLAFMPVFAIATAYSLDLQKLLPYLLRLVFFGSPILYSLDIVPERFQPLFFLNPMTLLVEVYRDLLLRGELPNLLAVGGYVGVMSVVLVLTSYLFVKFSPSMMRSVSRMY